MIKRKFANYLLSKTTEIINSVLLTDVEKQNAIDTPY